MDESTEPMPDTSKSHNSEYQDAKLTASQSQPSTSMSPASGGAGCPSPMDTTTASTSSHTGPPAEADDSSNVPVSNPMGQSHESPVDSPSVAERKEVREAGHDISSSSSSSLPSASDIETDLTPSHTDDTFGQQQLSDKTDRDSVVSKEEEESDSVEEPLPSAAVVSSSETSTSPPSEPVDSREVTSSNHQQPLEAFDEEPQAKHRRLSEEHGLPSSPLKPNSQDLEPTSSSVECPDAEASSTEQASVAMADTETSPTTGSAADTTGAVTTSHSPQATKTTLDSTADSSTVLPSPELSAQAEESCGAEVGGGDGDMPQSTLIEAITDPEGDSLKISGDSADQADQDMKDQISSEIVKESLASQAEQLEPSQNGSHGEPMDQD